VTGKTGKAGQEAGAATRGRGAVPLERARRRAPGPHRLAPKLWALGLGLVLSLGLGELLVRGLGLVSEPRQHLKPGIYTAEPQLGWGLLPDYRGTYFGYAYQVPTTTNRLGYRGPEWTSERAAAPLRVLALGDSCTFGLGVGDDETYEARLETRLRQSIPSAAVFNAGVPGYDTRQEREVLMRLGALVQPQVVVLGWLPNDILQPSSVYVPKLQVIDGYLIEDEQSYRDWRRSVDHAGIYSSALFRFLHTRRKLLGLRERTRTVQFDAERLRLGQEEISAIQAEVERLGARLVLILFPRTEEVRGEAPVGIQHHDAMAAFAESRGIEVVHLPRQWRERPDAAALYLAGDQVHPNARGYEQVANALAHTRTVQTAIARAPRPSPTALAAERARDAGGAGDRNPD
jgi:lysophospholipase L1-like esterase